MSAHPPRGVLAAQRDGQLSAWRRLRVGAHLARCARCRERLAALRLAADRTSSLLRGGLPAPDRGEAWARLAARRAGRPGSRGRRRTAVAAALAVAVGAGWLARRPAAAECVTLRPGDGPVAAATVRDVCCGDYDGGGRDDDGVLTLSDPDEWVTLVVVYEDADRNGAYSDGDIHRFRSAPACPAS